MRIWLVILLAVAGCGTGGDPTGDLAVDAAVPSSELLALDLAERRILPVAASADPADPVFRTRLVLFRRLPAGQARIGRAVSDGESEPDEKPPRLQAVDTVWMAVHELTQAQWTALAGTRPWIRTLPVLDTRPFLGDDLPAFGLSPRQAEDALAIAIADRWLLDLPEADEWERACLAGGERRYAWGDDADAAADWAVCDADAPLPVGRRKANAFGLHDMHGNAWELVRAGGGWELRGGGWDQPVVTARASNRLAVGPDTVAWSAGVRPVLRR